MRSIQDPKKKKPAAKKPVVTSQDPDFPVSLLSAVLYPTVGMKPIGPSPIKTDYKQPEIIETPPTPMLTGRQAVQVGRVAQDRENARYGQVLDKEYYWDDDLKRWQMRPVDEERLGRPFPRTDRKYRLIKASF